jgi:hypothetical protein
MYWPKDIGLQTMNIAHFKHLVATKHIYRPRDAFEVINIPFEAPKCLLRLARYITTIRCIGRKISAFKQCILPISQTSCATKNIYWYRAALEEINILFEAPKCTLQYAHKIITIRCIGRKISAFKQLSHEGLHGTFVCTAGSFWIKPGTPESLHGRAGQNKETRSSVSIYWS